jgi:uncharacterized repeat protein (TIGR03803 family)
MKMFIKPMTLVLAGLGLLAAPAPAQSFATLYSFTNLDGSTDGLVLSGDTLYGTLDGIFSRGSVFSVNTDGSDFTNLSFNEGGGVNSLILSGNTLYGTTEGGGLGYGTVFKISANGSGFTNLYSFTNGSDGAAPNALIVSGNALYGTCTASAGSGTVFSINTNGMSFTTLHTFKAGYWDYDDEYWTNSDGATPNGLLLSSNMLYGTASQGASSGSGTVFALKTNGTCFTNLYIFSEIEGANANNDGAYPSGGLILSGNTLYGTTEYGGSSGFGTVFVVNTNGTDFTNLYTFSAVDTNSDGLYTNSDGANPESDVILSGDTLYGTTVNGGSLSWGTIFAVNTNGTSFTNLHSFATGAAGGSTLRSGLVLSGYTLYGTESYLYFAGVLGGDIFALSIGPIPLNIQAAAGNVVLTWGNPDFSLQTAPTVSGVYTNIPGATSPYTNTFPVPQMFFRLRAN